MVEPGIVSVLVWYVEINKAYLLNNVYYPRRARSAISVDIVFTLDVCLYVSALERKRLIGMT